MPIYEYRCQSCGKKSSFFTQSINNPVKAVCSHCDSNEMERIISSFSYHRSLKTVHEESGHPPRFPGMDYYKDPRNIGRYVEDTFEKFGVDMPDSVRETIDAARQGEMPKDLDL